MLRAVSIRLVFSIIVLALSGAFAHAIMLAAGVWSSGLFLAPFGLVVGLATGFAEGWVRRALGHQAVGFWRGGVLGWGAFGLVGSVVAWISLQVALPAHSIAGVVAFAAPAVVAAAFVAGTVQALFATSTHPAKFAGRMAVSFAVSGLLIVLALRLGQPWVGVLVVTPIWTALVVRAVRV